MTRRTNKIILVTALLFTCCYLSLWQINRHYYLFRNSNKLNVSTAGIAENDKIRIQFFTAKFNCDSATVGNLLNRDDDEVVTVYNGEETCRKIPNKYGENFFLVSYDNRFFYCFKHVKLNGHFQHQYSIHVGAANGIMYLSVDIHGPNDLRFSVPMKRIKG